MSLSIQMFLSFVSYCIDISLALLVWYCNACLHFCHRCGINEDPVTGSAHCALAPYWSQQLGAADGSELVAFQASPRGGVLRLKLTDDGTRVSLTGFSVSTMKTTILA
ncbi:hypothetical protein EON65_16515 [archaeon]|nr:MAG: hypothetical protein EON65_16515 [archaeon]